MKWILMIIGILLSATSFAQLPSPQNSKLTTINQNIASLKTDLKKSHQKKSRLQQDLQHAKSRENKIQKQLHLTQNELKKRNKKLSTLKQLSAPLQNEINSDREALKQQIRAAYFYSQQPYLKLLLSPDDRIQSQQMMMYFRYATQAQWRAMQQLETSINQYQQNQAALQKQYAHLMQVKTSQLQHKKVLEKTQTERLTLIQQINQDIQTKHEKLLSLLRNKALLEKTLRHLSSTSNRVALGHTPFSLQRGKLIWPMAGTILHHFGTQVERSELRWDGVVIRSVVGKPVNTVATGRVIFAKWLAGYGMMIIINHGNGFMTLYGRNETLLKKVGDVVKAGDAIATAGESGGFSHPGLYFSIRHNGKPLNPEHWCR
ncbi:MAG: hypothetical protein A3I77_02870 [Gammaproteobacteria bacterium RIFCSPLOWO2_02_FULL_42_14]|nr:MAG: hypothetical protein A3B71_08295 [Gammaproteobacteria bacterium RIFCSPHIGHO2_02_FULL_42_43]OGT29525.1 MAG: hypothetical protein A2624_06275 [Gammaproteobacteria bacterium RIFCSPHIGHO2_01_FULL_42_8]OGT52411.1 MAG: hypothetical protein A3E54_02170 [Gammaproteobacteria bacterium RIFCSPHIGHO2_12_FULL_41_25]OGT62461.1 MAG: hypothetical protein A3I77_02870 [Gammaproteobacteria bacterium RIFCSPLOWO2_02_FULL_42_14]OGT86265.1 MAG: hypothetical protein A3G86_06985 [Gammaproteobacteria bacterium R